LGEIGIFVDSNYFWLEPIPLFGALDNFTGGIMFFSSERGISPFFILVKLIYESIVKHQNKLFPLDF